MGQVSVSCAQTDLVCKLHFKPLGWLGLWGGWHNVEVRVGRGAAPGTGGDGTWAEEAHIRVPYATLRPIRRALRSMRSMTRRI